MVLFSPLGEVFIDLTNVCQDFYFQKML